MCCGFKTHFLERRSVRFDSNAIEGLNCAFVRHVVGHKAEVTRIHLNSVSTEYVF